MLHVGISMSVRRGDGLALWDAATANAFAESIVQIVEIIDIVFRRCLLRSLGRSIRFVTSQQLENKFEHFDQLFL